MGVGLVIDDFGTGAASLATLQRLPVQTLKIDREYVTDLPERRDAQAICEALLALGRGLNIAVVAEGAETASEVTCLQQMGCDLFQGFFFSRPVPPDAITATFARLSREVALPELSARSA